MNKNGKLLRLASKMFIGVQSCNLRLVNKISIVFNTIPKPEYAQFYILERKFFMNLCQTNE